MPGHRVPVNDLSRGIRAQRVELDAAVGDVLDSGWVVLGPQVEAFEHELAAYLGAAHAVSLANGTDALTLSLLATGVGQGDRVVTAANAGGYATTAIRMIGATPVYADVDPDTALLSAKTLEGALDGAAAVIVTHLFGAMADLTEIASECRRRGIRLIEDCAQAIGARRDGRLAGTVGDAAAFSFYPTKNLGALGDGGAVVTQDATTAATLRSLRQYGWEGKYVVTRAGGRNSRLDELQAAILRRRLPLLDAGNARRREIHRRYAAALSAGRMIGPADESDVSHLAVAEVDDRDAVRERLAAAGIGTDVHYPVPDHRQPVEAAYAVAGELTETERLAGRILTLPCFPELEDAEVDLVCRELESL